jgi:glutathionyl-hydroquinone reductase
VLDRALAAFGRFFTPGPPARRIEFSDRRRRNNLRRIVDYPNLWEYTKDLYQQPGVAQTVNLGHIKKHYYGSHESINPTRIVPKGPVLDFDEPHDRWRFSG